MSQVRQLACRRRDKHNTHMHKDIQVQGTELGQEAREGNFSLAGFPTDQVRATLEPDGPKMLNRWDRGTDGGHTVGTDEFILNWSNPLRLECTPGILAEATGQLTCPTLHSGITPTSHPHTP